MGRGMARRLLIGWVPSTPPEIRTGPSDRQKPEPTNCTGAVWLDVHTRIGQKINALTCNTMKKNTRIGGLAAAFGMAVLAMAPGVSTLDTGGNASGNQQVSTQQSGQQVGQNQSPQGPGSGSSQQIAARPEQPKLGFGGGGSAPELRYYTRQFAGQKPYRPQKPAGPRTYNKTFHSRSRRRKAKRK